MVEDPPKMEEIQNHGADSVQAPPSNRDEILKQASFSAQRESRPHDSRSGPSRFCSTGMVSSESCLESSRKSCMIRLNR